MDDWPFHGFGCGRVCLKGRGIGEGRRTHQQALLGIAMNFTQSQQFSFLT